MTNSDNLLFCCFCMKRARQIAQGATAKILGMLCKLLLLVFWMPALGQAGPMPLPKQVAHVNIESHASLWVDTTGNMSAEEVTTPAHAALFMPLKGPLSLGFTDAVAWVRLSLTSTESSRWLLEVGQPILEDVRLYERSPDGRLSVRYGTSVTGGLPRELSFRKPMFQMDLKAGEDSVFYLRLSSRTAMVTDLKLWSPNVLFEQKSRESFVWGLVFGAYILVIFFYSAFWLWTRERVHLYYVLYVATNLGAAFMTGRWIDMLGLDLNTQAHTLILGLFIGFSLWIGPLFSVSYLGTHRTWPRYSKVFLTTCASISLLGMGGVLLGFYSQAIMTVQITSMFVIFITLSASGHLAWRGDKKAQLMLLAFSLFYVGILWRYLRNIGLIEPNWWNESVYQIGAFVHMMVISTGIFSSYNALRRKSEQEQARANEQERQRQRQIEFLGMVSHEVRTPLTVIAASADNLLLDGTISVSAKARIEKIIQHSEKIRHLFDSYLDNEHLLVEDHSIQMVKTNLTALCESVINDVQDAHHIVIQFKTDQLPEIRCNPDLLRVALSNLLENARKHSLIETGIQLELRRESDHVLICVTDQGMGIDDEDLPFIFEPYFRGKKAYMSKGSGLGLHLVKFIAEQHKGRAYAIKQRVCGMQFVIELPLTI